MLPLHRPLWNNESWLASREQINACESKTDKSAILTILKYMTKVRSWLFLGDKWPDHLLRGQDTRKGITLLKCREVAINHIHSWRIHCLRAFIYWIKRMSMLGLPCAHQNYLDKRAILQNFRADLGAQILII